MSCQLSIERIVSGGQTGVDRAALDAALAAGVECGGWCPKGRKAEDGPLADRYPLQETPTARYAQRTEWNVRDSDGTLILARGELTGGTALTESFALALHRPCLVVDPDNPDGPAAVTDWVYRFQIRVLNLAGPRESTQPGIYESARSFLDSLLSESR